MGEVILTMKGIDKSFPGVHALDHVDLEVRKGEVHALMGENGAGKSTLMKVLTGIYKKDSGTITYEGKEVEFHNTREAQDAGVVIVHQELNMLGHLTVAQNIFIGREFKKGIRIDDKKMNEEIIPEILKAHKDLGGTRFKDISIISEETLNELNPDWQKKLENSGFEKRMKEMSDLQSEGADVYMGAFSQLKSFPFFYDMANWFYPFDEDCYEIVGCLGGMKGSMLGVIVRSPFFCNSDKYSMCFMMSQVPQQQRELMMRQFDGQDEAVRMLRDEYENFESRNCSNQYIQDLYRFFKLFSRKREFDDIFRWGIAMLKTECLSSLFEWETGCLNIADFLFKNGHFGDACQYYAGSGMTEKAEVVQKMGFCRQKLNDFSEAKRLYEKADLIEPDNAWTMKHLAMCCIVDNDIDAAIDIYRKLEARYENDWNIIFQLGKCFLRKEAYVDAMKCFYKSDYLKPGHAPVQRTMAWTLFCMGKPDEALPLYEKIKPEDRTQNDYINMGHVLWICGNVEKAVEAYKKGVALSDKSIFATIMDEDSTLLHGHGLDKADIAIMKDIVLND